MLWERIEALVREGYRRSAGRAFRCTITCTINPPVRDVLRLRGQVSSALGNR